MMAAFAVYIGMGAVVLAALACAIVPPRPSPARARAIERDKWRKAERRKRRPLP